MINIMYSLYPQDVIKKKNVLNIIMGDNYSLILARNVNVNL